MVRHFKYYFLLFLLLSLKSNIFAYDFGKFKIPETVTVEVKPAPGALKEAVEDLMDAVSGGLGKTTEKTTEDIIGGVLKGVERTATGGQFGKTAESVIGETVSQGAKALEKAATRPDVRKSIFGASKEWASIAGSAVTGFAEDIAPALRQVKQEALNVVFNPRDIVYYGSLGALAIALPLAGIYGSKLFWKYMEQKLLSPKPEIVVKSANPKFGRWDRVRRWWKGYKIPPMIFDQSVKDRLTEIEEKTKKIRELIKQGRNITYDNLLLYGKPGTGKTLFAQILADKTDMDFLPVTAASLLQAGVEGIKYFNELLDFANKSKYGVIIFVDEADALFIDRNTLDPSSDHYKVLNHILAATGTGSNKFMLVAATNHAYVMDEAMGRRFQDRVHMPLPDSVTRLALLDLYFAGTLFNPKENNENFITKAKSLLTPGVVNDIVQRTNGLSHAEIKDMVSTMNKTAQISGITAKIINNVVNNAIEKHKVSEEERMKREERFGVKQEEVIIMPKAPAGAPAPA